MTAQLDEKKNGADIGFSIRDSAKTLAFYCDTLGFEHVMDMALPAGVSGAGVMHRVACGSTTLKFLCLDAVPDEANLSGGPRTATGLRYFTVWVTNLDELVETCRQRGYNVVVEPHTIRPGVRIGFVEDPDGVWVEFLENTAQ
jgi:catechol 2,3-dioxygenase-like lactoylglutathione lyase family enzyme